jgi:hypothetical protein
VCWWSGHFYVIARGEDRGSRSVQEIGFAPHRWRQALHIARSGFAFLGASPLALWQVAAPAPKQWAADISGQVSAFVGLRATASSNRRRRSARAGWLASFRAANYGHEFKGIYSPVP